MKHPQKELKTEILINADYERIWGILVNFEDYPNWNPFIKSIEGKPEVGLKIKARMEPPGASGMTFKPKILALKRTGNSDGLDIYLYQAFLMENINLNLLIMVMVPQFLTK